MDNNNNNNNKIKYNKMYIVRQIDVRLSLKMGGMLYMVRAVIIYNVLISCGKGVLKNEAIRRRLIYTDDDILEF